MRTARKKIVQTSSGKSMLLYQLDIPAEYLVDIYNALTFTRANYDAYVLTTGVDPKSVRAVDDMLFYLDHFIEELSDHKSTQITEYN